MNDEFPSAGRILLWIFVFAIGATMFVGALGMTLGVVSLPFRVFNQANRFIDRTIDADNVIYNYEYFKKACQDIKAQDAIIRNAEAALEAFGNSAGPRTGWDYNDKQEHARLGTNVTGAKNTRQQMIAEYNARAQMVNRKLFNIEPCNTLVTP